MTASPSDEESVFARYQLHFGLGVLLVIIVSVMLFRGGIMSQQEPSQEAAEHTIPPPMPTTEVEVIENEVIEQAEIEYDTSLRIGTVTTSTGQ